MISLDDLIDRFGERELANLTDRENYAVIDETIINHAIADATSEINSYLNPTGLIADGVYIGTPPKALVIKACDIARYYLYENGTPEIVEVRYKQAIDWLKLVSKTPTMLTGTQTASSNSGVAVMPNPVPNVWR